MPSSRPFRSPLAILALLGCLGHPLAGEDPFEPSYGSLEKHQLPAWFDDAKLGIFIHWGIYSVPGWAPPAGRFGEMPEEEFFRQNPYAEWYFNSMRTEGSPTHAHHLATYGEEFDYYDFADDFNDEVKAWDPDAMAELFRDVHARYVVLTTKHHDGFTLWPSEVKHPGQDGINATRDIVGELNTAVTDRGLKMGVYYSGGIDWSFRPVLIDGSQSGPEITPTGDYLAYADAHLRELIDRYQPSILWNDIRYPEDAELLRIVADYYNARPEGVINDRWGRWMWRDFTTAEYRVLPRIEEKKWEANRGIGNSFGFNRAEGPEHMISVDELVDSFADIVSKNGNLLLNVGPRPDGSIPAGQVERLRGLGRWLDVNGEAIFATRPWVDFAGKLRGGDQRVRFTHHPQRDTVYAILLDPPSDGEIVLEDLVPTSSETTVRLLGHPAPLVARRDADALRIELPDELPESPAHVIAIHPQPAKLMRKDGDE